MQSSAKTVEEYLKEIPEDRQEAISKVREVILKNLPKGYVEVMNGGMITYEVPLEIYPDTYNKKPLMYAALASQKNHIGVYLMSLYSLPGVKKEFERAYEKLGKKPNMGKCCLRFKKLEEIPLDLVGKVIAETSMEDYVKYAKECRQR